MLGVKFICSKAFALCTALTEVQFGNKLKKNGSDASIDDKMWCRRLAQIGPHQATNEAVASLLVGKKQ